MFRASLGLGEQDVGEFAGQAMGIRLLADDNRHDDRGRFGYVQTEIENDLSHPALVAAGELQGEVRPRGRG